MQLSQLQVWLVWNGCRRSIKTGAKLRRSWIISSEVHSRFGLNSSSKTLERLLEIPMCLHFFKPAFHKSAMICPLILHLYSQIWLSRTKVSALGPKPQL